MQSKLTIGIDKDLIEEAKKYAKKHNQSLSSIIENYLRLILKSKPDTSKISTDIKLLKGSLKLPENFDYKTELSKAIIKRYSR